MRPLILLMQVRTCPPALGFSFAAGTTDGPGSFDFTQGPIYSSIMLWRRKLS